MARVTIEDCLVKIPNRFEMVEVAAKRARQIALDGASPLVSSEKNNKVAVTVLREIAEGLIGQDGQTSESEE
jgi:DNA-directed RNA polymerase subunit omega